MDETTMLVHREDVDHYSYLYSYILYIAFTDYVVYFSYLFAESLEPLPEYIYLPYIFIFLHFTDLEVVFFYYFSL